MVRTFGRTTTLMYFDVLLSFPVLAVTSGRNHLVIQVDLPRLRLSGQLIWIETLWLMCENTRWLPLLSVSRRGNSTGPEYKHTKNLLITRWVVTWYLCPSPFKRKNGCTTTTKKFNPRVWRCYRACIKAASIRKYERWTYSPPPETSHLICMCDFAFAAHGGCDPRLWPEQFSVTEYAQMCSS